ncbi:MAG: UpxY family transcription antiterminator [Gemmatimonadetes bacterium]|nr:UpxY family transcription antiterminator [Gemmatimonadota bacterium]
MCRDPSLAHGPGSDLYTRPRWYACRTKARQEKTAARSLAGRGLETYLPLYDRLRQWADRKKTVLWPLFTGYVFARFTLRDQHAVLSAPGVATIVRVDGRPTPIPDSDIENVRRFAAALSATRVDPVQVRYPRRGERVTVASGPFAGVEGVVVRRGGRQRVIISVRGLRQSFAVTVQVRELEQGRSAGLDEERG